jgi:hypothetical protein
MLAHSGGWAFVNRPLSIREFLPNKKNAPAFAGALLFN